MGKAQLEAKASAMARPRPDDEPVIATTGDARRVERRGVAILYSRPKGEKNVAIGGRGVFSAPLICTGHWSTFSTCGTNAGCRTESFVLFSLLPSFTSDSALGFWPICGKIRQR